MQIALAGRETSVKNYAAALAGVGLAPAVTLEPAAIGACAGLVLPGGGDIEPALYGRENQGSRDMDESLDRAQLAMLEAFLSAGKPVLGICKGCQLLNVRFGGGLIQHLRVAEAHAWSGGDRVHPCGSNSGSVMERLYGRRFSVNSCHHQALGAIGRGLRVTAWAPDGVVEAVEHDSIPLLGVQFHPERMCFAKARRDTADGAEIFQYFKGLLRE